MKRRRTQRTDKIASVYDQEILPVWSTRFGRMLLRQITAPPPKATVLNVACATGYPALELLDKLDKDSRIIAIDHAAELLNIARNKAGSLPADECSFALSP